MNVIFVIGIALITGYLFGKAVKYIKLPSVTGYILGGLLVGSSFLNLIPYNMDVALTWIINFALMIVAFNVGGELGIKALKRLGKPIVSIVIFESLSAFLFITFLVYIAGLPILQAFLIGAIGAATAPAVTITVIREYKARGPISQVLLACTGIDDAIGLTLYAITSTILQSHMNNTQQLAIPAIVLKILIGLIISVIVGIISGYIINLLAKYARTEIEYIVLTLGILLTFGGFIQDGFRGIELSPLLAAMVAGFFITNWSKKKKRIFSSLDTFGPVFYLLYFVLAGARLKVRMLLKLGKIATGYLIGRFVGKYVGTFVGGKISHAPATVTKYAGMGLISQAGIAIGLCVVAAQQFPTLSDLIVAIALGTTIVTELTGPLLTKIALTKGNEINAVSRTS
ncbi:MAG: cation:proton antiporter [Proteobacteria bacterium]|nr:cation:proton antiporter [Pseudomonadota bacterium]